MTLFSNINRGGVICKQEPSKCDAEVILKQLLLQQLHGSCCNKLIRRTCYNKYDIRFPKDIIRWEDLFVVCSLLMHPIKCAYLPKALYHYDLVINDNSIVRKTTKLGLLSQIRFIEFFREKGCSVDLLYHSMRATKELVYFSGIFDDKQAVSLFSEINEEYVSEKVATLDFLHKGLSALICGERMKSNLYKSMYYLWLLKKRLKWIKIY